MTKTILRTTALFIAVVFVIACSQKTKPGAQYTRIIEMLSKEHVIETPFRNLIENFNHVEEDTISEWKLIPPLSDKEHKVWAATTSYAPLVRNRYDRPQGMKLWEGEKEIPYLDSSPDSEQAWKWLSTSENLELTSHERYIPKFQGVRLERGQSIEFERIFPKSLVTIDLHVVNPNWERSRPRLKILFDGEIVKEIKVSRRKKFSVRYDAEMGYHTLSIQYSHDQGNTTATEFVILGEVRLINSSDVILLSKITSEEIAPPSRKYSLEYYTSDPIPIKNIPAVPAETIYLYTFQNQYANSDNGITGDPFSLKKKIRFGETTQNLISAPPLSVFTIPVTIPPEGILDFGYGFFMAMRKKAPNPIYRFLISIERSGRKEVIWSQDLNPESDELMSHARLDVSAFAGKKAKLTFRTEEVSPSSNQIEGVICLPVWDNPVLYTPEETEARNVILISMDTLRPDHLGCYGYDEETSPAIDAFSQDAVLFKNVYSTTSWTLPAHVSLLTGLNCANHMVYFPFQKIDPTFTTLADILRGNGYYTAAFTGGGYMSPSYGFAKGFDTYHSMRLGGDTDVRLDEAERLSERTCQWLQDNKDKSFFLFLHTYQPHDPYANFSEFGRIFLDQNAKWDRVKMESLFGDGGRFDTHLPEDDIRNIVALYDGEIRYMDEKYIRPILEKLKDLELYDDSLIILTSDHGEEFYEHEAWLHDHSIYDESVKIPLIVKFPDSKYQGTTVDQITRITDIMPTVLDNLGIKNHQLQLDGESLLPLITGKEKDDRIFFVDLALRNFREMYPTILSTNRDRFKMILNKEINSPYTMRVSKSFNGIKTELYNLSSDPSEIKNLILHIEHRDLCLKMARDILGYYKKLEAEILKKDDVVLDQDLVEQLRALGYIR